MPKPSFTKEQADERRRASNREQWEKPLRQPVEWKLDDYGRGQQP